ncbi:hypothetical protein NSQ43_05445 [Sporosarcina sp. FSL W8-0480]|uniref:hypothetical protein n=1 Tax=Sporosarcina sp. FSL W8-0480 TaxID=2954701 RepID=UPI0030DDA8EB
MNKKYGALLSVIGVVTAIFIVLGLVFDKSENEKQQGLNGVFDVSIDGTIAYIEFEDGKAGIYLTDGSNGPIVQLPVEQTIRDISFSNDGNTLAYIVSDKELDTNGGSEVRIVKMEMNSDELLFSSENIITELVFDPKNSNLLFYLQAGVYTNYSPITGKRPHDFDVYSYDLKDKTQKRNTELKKYSMQSLQVSATDESVFVQMDDDENIETAEELFASKQRIFQIPLNELGDKTVISNPVGEEDIYDFLVLPDREELIYQAVGGTGENGVFEYELFSFNRKTYETKQLTKIKEHASKPILGPDRKIYFLVDRNFGGRQPNFYIYQMSIDGTDIKEIKW